MRFDSEEHYKLLYTVDNEIYNDFKHTAWIVKESCTIFIKYSISESGYKSNRKFENCKKLNKFQIPWKRMLKEKNYRNKKFDQNHNMERGQIIKLFKDGPTKY